MLFMGLEKPFTSRKLTDLLKKHTSPIIHLDISIAPQNLGKPHKLLQEDDEDGADSIEAEQMGHSSATEKAHYGLSSNGWEGVSDEIVRLFLSPDQFQYLMPQSDPEPDYDDEPYVISQPSRSQNIDSFSKPTDDQHLESHQRLMQTVVTRDGCRHLQSTYSNEFKQREAVQALLNLEHDVIVAMQTATEKSLVFILAALLQRAFSVLETSSGQLWNSYHHFHADDEVPDLTGEHKIILVSSDVGCFRNWEKVVNTLNTHTPVMYMGDTKFRQFIANPDALHRFPCQSHNKRGAKDQYIVYIIQGMEDSNGTIEQAALPPPHLQPSPLQQKLKDAFGKVCCLLNKNMSGKVNHKYDCPSSQEEAA
ncbi:hypothetical protein C8J56DRAFT_892476 [Mycena floridula]|nr:hypothetical protein C8J56DRAFT_892476 [Mycena floridula]